MISRELEVSLHTAFVEARQKRYEFITVEHLLLALLDNPTAAEVLLACGAKLDALRKRLTEHIDEHTPRVAADREVDTQPTHSFQRVIQGAILHAQSGSAKEVTGAGVLVALFGEKDSPALQILQQQGIARLSVLTYVSHGVAAIPSSPEAPSGEAPDVQVVLYNDDHTPMEFVVRVLQEFFSMDKEEATEVMLEVHRNGQAVCGLYSRKEGDDVVRQVLAHAREHGHPLRCAALTPK